MSIKLGVRPDCVVRIGNFVANRTGGISSIVIVQSMDSADSAEIIMDNVKDSSGKRNIDRIKKGDYVEIELGYVETKRQVVFAGTVESRKPSLSKIGGAMLSIQCVGLEFNLLNEKINENQFLGQTLYGIASSIIAGSGLSLNIINAPQSLVGSPIENPEKHFDENKTKMQCLQELAREFGYDIVTLANKIMTWYPKDFKDGKAITIKYGYNLLGGEIDDSEVGINVVTVKAGRVNETIDIEWTEEDKVSLSKGIPRKEMIVYNPSLGTLERCQAMAKSLLATELKKEKTGFVSCTGSFDFKKRGLVDIQDDGTIGMRGIFEIKELTHYYNKVQGWHCDMQVHQGEVIVS